MIVSQKIFALLQQRGMSQKEFSMRTEISQSTISDWKTKKTNPAVDKIMKICEVLQVTPYELLSEDDEQDMPFEVESKDVLVLGRDERFLIESFHKLDVKQQQRLLGYVEGLIERNR